MNDFNSECGTYRSMEVANAKMPLTPHNIPERPLTKIVVNLFTLNNIDYLILVDDFSGYFEVDDLLDTLFCCFCYFAIFREVPFSSIWTV